MLEQEDTFILQNGPHRASIAIAGRGRRSRPQVYLEFARQQALAWTEEEVTQVSEAVGALRPETRAAQTGLAGLDRSGQDDGT